MTSSLYFKSQTAEYIYYLTQMDGKLRAKNLGITRFMYSNKKAAENWKHDILGILEAENHPYRETAEQYLEEIYQLMIMR